MKLKLASIDPWQPTLNFCVDEFPVVVGNNGVSQVVIEDRWVGAQHCEITDENGALVVRDLHSEHGTLVNGERIERHVLAPGDTLSVGIRTFRVSYRRSKPSQQASREKEAATC